MSRKRELIFLAFILLFSVFIRSYQLGYSHFYGDEIKTLYLRKDVSALNFLMDQRKGPGQFIASWAAEKVSGGYSETWIRLPYALAGTLLVFAVYYFIKDNFGIKVALISASLFSLNGFYIAFSRTAQYQVLYLLFGFTALIFAKRNMWVSSLFLALSFLCHYDALFFLIPLFFYSERKMFLKITALALIVSLCFYLPNIYLGYFESNTVGYLSKRLSGADYLKNNSLYTMSVYNPYHLYLAILSLFFVVGVIRVPTIKIGPLLCWTAIPFIVFQLVLLNPGTHIHNYLLPAIFVAALGLDYLLGKVAKQQILATGLLIILFGLIYAIQLWTYIPFINPGYPWKINRPSSQYHLYLYGFPYNRGWDKVGSYLRSQKGVRNFYTNDNENTAEYYLYGIPHTPPGSNFLPQYYVEVKSPQQLQTKQVLEKNGYEKLNVAVGADIAIYKLGK